MCCVGRDVRFSYPYRQYTKYKIKSYISILPTFVPRLFSPLAAPAGKRSPFPSERRKEPGYEVAILLVSRDVTAAMLVGRYIIVLSDEGPMLETLDHTIRIGSTPTFLYSDLYLYSAYAAHYVYIRYTLGLLF